jgi:hypothetical protein
MIVRVTPEDLILQLSTVIDAGLARGAVGSYVEMEQRFLAGDWGPSELDGGHVCEAVSRCLLQYDTGIIDNVALPGKIEQILTDSQGAHTHKLILQDRKHVTKMINAVYKLRSDRGVAHISPIYTANAMDAMLVLHASKWIFAEMLRLVWNGDRNVVGEVIGQLAQLEHAVIHELDGQPLVLIEKISAPDEILVLLNHAPSHQLSRAKLRDDAKQKPQNVNVAINRLIGTKDIRPLVGSTDVALTPKGQKRVREEVMPKLTATK